MTNKLKLFENQKIRADWNAQEEWYFSVVDVVAILTDSDYSTARKYWNKLKQRLGAEGSELVTFCHQLKMTSPLDGKSYNTDCLTTSGILRLIQSIPSPKDNREFGTSFDRVDYIRGSNSAAP